MFLRYPFVLLFALTGPALQAESPPRAGQSSASAALAEQRRADAIRQGRKAVQTLVSLAGVPGLSVAVGIDGQVIWSEGFGSADLEQGVPVTPLTRFRIASVAKVVTAAAVARLHEQGKLDLDAPVQSYLPSFPDKGHAITVRQLAGQLGGIRHYEARDFAEGRNIDFKHYGSLREAVEIFKEDPLVAPPGTRYHYSTFGYTLVGAVIEAVSGGRFPTYLRDEILQPLNLRHTLADERAEIIEGRTAFYERREGRIVNAPYLDNSYKWPAGGLVSTAKDLVAFGAAHLRPGFFKPETLDLLFRPQRTTSGQETGVGIGWRTTSDLWGRRFVHHSGSQAGTRSVLVVYRDAGLAVALLSNLTGMPAFVEGTAQAIAGPFLETLEPVPAPAAAVDPSGAYDYVLESPEESGGPASGTIEIVRTAAGYEGWMTNPKPLADLAARNNLPAVEKLPLLGLTLRGAEATIVAASPLGLYPLRLSFETGAFAGTLRAHASKDPTDRRIRGSRRAPRSTGSPEAARVAVDARVWSRGAHARHELVVISDLPRRAALLGAWLLESP